MQQGMVRARMTNIRHLLRATARPPADQTALLNFKTLFEAGQSEEAFRVFFQSDQMVFKPLNLIISSYARRTKRR
jgi:hypothetical protein